MRKEMHSSGEMTDAASQPAPRGRDVLIVGVGGQGVVMVSKLLATLAQRHGFEVKQSEVHGMAKRGGAVFSHVRFADKVFSPTIPEGQADIIVALEWAEGLRWLPYLKPESGVLIADTQRIVPPFACRDRRIGARLGYVGQTVEGLAGQVPNSMALDAVGMATDLGVAKAANTVLLGALSVFLDFELDEWEDVIANTVPPATVQANLKAFTAGRGWAHDWDPAAVPEPETKVEAPLLPENFEPEPATLEITPEWCKSCDICVRFCPERCLRLDENRIVEIFAPEKCTGCRICEWLCPDFAITVHTESINPS